MQRNILIFFLFLNFKPGQFFNPCDENNPNETFFIPDPRGNCSSFYVCTRGKATRLSCQPGVWDNTTSACVPKHSHFDSCSEEDLNNGTSFCSDNESKKVANENNCAQYYDCFSRQSGVLMGPPWEHRLVECPYPMLFNNQTNRCEPYPFVECGQRYEPKQPCDYMANQCHSVGATRCEPCSKRFPSCSGLKDGLQPWDSKDPWSAMFMTCKDQRVLTRGRCPSSPGRQGIFHPKLKFCVTLIINKT